jgi:hypoxanthine phosphoribosyltransferase
MVSMASQKSAAYTMFLHAKEQSINATIADVTDLARDLAGEIAALSPRADMIVGLANGAFLPAKVVGETLGLPWHMVKVRRKGTRYKRALSSIAKALRIPPQLILWGPFRAMWVFFQDRTSKLEESGDPLGFDPAGRHVVMVDDVVETGNSFRLVADKLTAAGAASVRTAVYCWSVMPKIPEEQSRPDIHLHRRIQFYPWSQNTTQVGAFDRWLADNRLELWR